jgi:hypothetical protein
VDPGAGLDYLDKKQYLTLPGLEFRPLGRPARSQSRYSNCAIPAPITVKGAEENLFYTGSYRPYRALASSSVPLSFFLNRQLDPLNE